MDNVFSIQICILSDVLNQTLQNDVIKGVYQRSHFKHGQLDSLVVKRFAENNGLSLGRAIAMRDKSVTKGSFQRSASQAENVIAKSVGTLVLALSLGLVDYDVADSLVRVAKVVEASRATSISDQEAHDLLLLVDGIIRKSSHG